jgi:hypothetical protein
MAGFFLATLRYSYFVQNYKSSFARHFNFTILSRISLEEAEITLASFS